MKALWSRVGVAFFEPLVSYAIFGLLYGRLARADASQLWPAGPAVWFTLSFLNLVTWHGQVQELQIVHSTTRGGADWRRIIVNFVLLEPLRDGEYGFGTMYERLFSLNIKPAYTFSLYRLSDDNVPCADFTPANVIALELTPPVSERFWNGWPPPPPPPKPNQLVVLSDPFVKRRKVSNALAGRGGGAAAADGIDGTDGGAPAVAAPLGWVPPAGEADGEEEHGQDIEEENLDQDCVGEGLMDNPILEGLIGGDPLRNSVQFEVDMPAPEMEPVVVCGPPAAEDEAKAGDDHLQTMIICKRFGFH